MLSTTFQVSWLASGEKAKNIFHNGGYCGHLGFSIGTLLAIFDLQVTPMLPTELQVILVFSSRKEAKSKFSR